MPFSLPNNMHMELLLLLLLCLVLRTATRGNTLNLHNLLASLFLGKNLRVRGFKNTHTHMRR